MRIAMARAAWATGLVVTLVGCAAAQTRLPDESNSYAGWYMEHAGQGMFQPCGQSQQWRVAGAANLRAKAEAFGLDQDTPVYVRLLGHLSNNALVVTRVEQFGSDTPIRDCAMTGVVIPAPSPGEN